MKTLGVIALFATVGYSLAFITLPTLPSLCSTDGDCAGEKCCLFGRVCSPKLPVHSTCYLTAAHKCGCVSGSSCQVTFEYTIPVINKKVYLRQCVKDSEPVSPVQLDESQDDEAERARRSLIRRCSSETVARDCGKDRCCLLVLGQGYCAPLLRKYMPCHFQNSYTCPCASGLECKVTKTLKIPFTSKTISFKHCMPVAEKPEVEEVEMTET